jgi:hypothetical protein
VIISKEVDVAKVKEQFKSNWKSILWGFIPLAVVAIVFALPIKTVAVKVTESYWDTEIKSEPYTVTESYTDTESYTAIETETETIYDSYISTGNWEQSFKIDEADSTVSIILSGYPSYQSYPLVVYSTNSTSALRFWPYSYYPYWSGRSKIVVKASYPVEVIKQREVTKLRDVTKYRDVPTQVQKERIVTQYVKKSIWGYLFMKPE